MPVTTAGPNERAGFIDPPVSGPIAEDARRHREPDREAADLRRVRIDRGAEHDEHEEERRDRLEHDRLDAA